MRPPTEDTLTIRIRHAIDAGAGADTLLALAVQLDRCTQPPVPVPLLSAALWYVEHGLHVFPLTPGRKIPLPRSKGCLDATTDGQQIVLWWRATPQANVGIATGHRVDVIDVDGPPGVQSWADLVDSGTLPPVLGSVSTLRAGGTHLYVTATGEGNGAALWPGIDYRGVGGYVVAPPSLGPDGSRYRWRTPLTLAPTPAPAPAPTPASAIGG